MKVHVAEGASGVPTWQVGLPASVPNAESSRDAIVALTVPLLVTTNVNVTLPPVSGTLSGLGLFVTETTGSTSLNVTVAEPDPAAGLPRLSTTPTVTVLVCGVSGAPDKVVV